MPTRPKPNMCHYVLTLHLISCAEKDSLCGRVMSHNGLNFPIFGEMVKKLTHMFPKGLVQNHQLVQIIPVPTNGGDVDSAMKGRPQFGHQT